MIGVAERGSRASLLVHIVVPVLIAGATDALLRSLGWNQPAGEVWPDFAPRGGAIGAIWVVLFACMGAAGWLVARSARPGTQRRANLIGGLIVVCLAYPFYTHFIRGHGTELAGNIVSFALAATIVRRIRRDSRVAAALIGLVAAWIVFATVLVFALVRLNGWQTA